MPSRARLLPLAALLAISLTGCASQRLAVTAPPGVALSGNWALDPVASGDIAQTAARLQAQIGKAHHVRQHARPADTFGRLAGRRPDQRPGDSDEAPGAGNRSDRRAGAPAGPAGAPPPGAALVREFLANVPGGYLRISVAPGSFRVTSENGSQQYSPGVETAVELGEASAEQTCGWKGHHFIIDTQPRWGPVLTQSFGLAPDGRLVVTVRLHGQGIDAVLTLRYQRTRQTPAAVLPTSD